VTGFGAPVLTAFRNGRLIVASFQTQGLGGSALDITAPRPAFVKNRANPASSRGFVFMFSGSNFDRSYSKPMKTRPAVRLAAVILVVSNCLSARVQLPDTPAAHQLSAWLAAFNSGDRATLLTFLQKNFPARAPEIDREMGFHGETGGFDLKTSGDCTAPKCSAILQERRSDQFARIVVDVDPAEPHAIKGLELRAIPRPADFPITRVTQTEALKAFRVYLNQAAAAGRFSGTALVARNGKPVFTAAYGMADRDKKIANQLGTQFRIGSMNKMFTATAVLQLVQAGKINLTDPLGKYLPDYPNKDVASKVTVHHLLTHTGGTGDFFGPEFDKHRLELRTLQDYVKLYGHRSLAFEPGSRWEYSNYGFLLLGLVVEKASGQDYYEYVREHIFKPAGMNSTDSLPEDQLVPGRSVGYTKMNDARESRTNADTLPYRGTSAGGGYSTVEDLLAFANALENHKLLDARHVDLLTTGKVERPDGGSKYGYGFGDEISADGVRCFGHGGGAPGMNGDLKICPQSGYVIAVLANLDPQAAGHASDFIAARLPKD
jgi:D-alanyl-D-alanine carboxypeptidase